MLLTLFKGVVLLWSFLMGNVCLAVASFPRVYQWLVSLEKCLQSMIYKFMLIRKYDGQLFHQYQQNKQPPLTSIL
jgi:hypothetical protein